MPAAPYQITALPYWQGPGKALAKHWQVIDIQAMQHPAQSPTAFRWRAHAQLRSTEEIASSLYRVELSSGSQRFQALLQAFQHGTCGCKYCIGGHKGVSASAQVGF